MLINDNGYVKILIKYVERNDYTEEVGIICNTSLYRISILFSTMFLAQLNLLFDGKGIVASSGMDSLLWFLFHHQGDFRFPKSLLVFQEKLE